MKRNLEFYLDSISVHAPGMWENDQGPKGWYAVSDDDDGGIIAYFQNETDAYRYRMRRISDKLNPY